MGLRNQVAFAIAATLAMVIVGLAVTAIVSLIIGLGKDFGLDRMLAFLGATFGAVPILYWVIRRIKARIDTDDRDG